MHVYVFVTQVIVFFWRFACLVCVGCMYCTAWDPMPFHRLTNLYYLHKHVAFLIEPPPVFSWSSFEYRSDCIETHCNGMIEFFLGKRSWLALHDMVGVGMHLSAVWTSAAGLNGKIARILFWISCSRARISWLLLSQILLLFKFLLWGVQIRIVLQ